MSLTKRIPEVLGLVAALVLASGCETLNVKNPNAPDAPRIQADPTTWQAVAIGAMRTWYNTTQGGTGPDADPQPLLAVMAKSHVAAWNNFNIRFYTGCTDYAFPGYPNGSCNGSSQGTPYPRVAWQNDPASRQRTQIEPFWYGYNSALSSANDVLRAIRLRGVVITDAATTKVVETMAVLVQGLALSGLSMNYDQAFIVDENTPLDASGAPIVALRPRKEVRDSAVAKLDQAIALAVANTFTAPVGFFDGISYDHVKIAQIARTMAARTLAYYPRDAAENADIGSGGQVDWTRVATYASNGISAATVPFDWNFHVDACVNWCDFLKVWTNDASTMRVHTRVAHLLDPATQPDPWDLPTNSAPNSPDHRLGDGTFRGPPAYACLILCANPDLTGNGGYDFIWSYTQEIQNPARGYWHQSAIGQVRYDSLAGCGDNPQGSSSPGDVDTPIVLAAENDLIWAEALLRKPAPDAATAANLINFTRHGPDRLGRPRGNLPLATGTLAEVQYEQDVELIGSNNAPYYNQRRIDNLEPGTPHEMPVPAKELGVLQLPLYTWGGIGGTPNSNPTAPARGAAMGVVSLRNVQQVWAEMEHEMLMGTRSGRGFRR